ncbi:MAG TPA: endonuclease/exonuclease/phosphatase family protein [Bryobacteraceae bacterium]
MITYLRASAALLVILACTSIGRAEEPAVTGPPKLTFEELLRLALNEEPPPALADKLHRLLNEPFISNEAASSGAGPLKPAERGLGPLLRVAEWNIARGVHEPEIEMSLSRTEEFLETARRNRRNNGAKLVHIQKELEILRDADVIILNEVDMGMRRSGYRDVVRTLAEALHFNYVYGVEFVELNRLYLGQKHMNFPASQGNPETFGLDPKRYLGLEGNAVLSRYPIRGARIVPLPPCYDWFYGEMQQLSDLESARRWSAEKLFAERIRRQVRRGQRMALLVDLETPDAPGGQVTIVAPHLEDYCRPRCRQRQMSYLLDGVKGIANPVILGGDLNTNNHDGTPTSVRRELLKRILNYHFWIRESIYFLAPVPFAGVISTAVNFVKNYHDPTALNMRILAPNHEKRLFQTSRNFRFADGGAFEFRGRKRRTTGHKGRTLAETNQRAWKGFAPTFVFRRTFLHLVGSYKLDWLFVKPSGQALTPYYGRTLRNLNSALEERLSDHAPITVDLPLVQGANRAAEKYPAVR